MQLLATPADRFLEIATGFEHSCGILESGVVACWGDGSHGQLDAPGGVFDHIAALGDRTCGLRRGGGVLCWGKPVPPLPTLSVQ